MTLHISKRLTVSALVLLLSGTALIISAPDPHFPGQAAVSVFNTSMPSQAENEPDAVFSLFDYGPGIENLSSGAPFARYQWGLKNTGEYQLWETVRKFKAADQAYDEGKSQAGADGLHLPAGPSDFETRITQAQAGIDINIQPAWSIYDQKQNKREIIVAVIDTGIDINHLDLKDSIWTNQDEVPGDGIDNDGNGYVDDINGWNFFNDTNQIYVGAEDNHGTHAAGTIAATRSSGGIAGIADNRYVKIMPLKALGSSSGIGTPEDVIAAIRYAEAKGASICNLSFGTYKHFPDLEQTIRDSGMLFIVSAGNGDSKGIGYNSDQHPVYPASFAYDNIISVANLMFDGALDVSSNYGAASVDIAAPGSYILSTTTGNNYGFMSGTSMSAPMVTGVAALLYSYDPSVTLTDVRNILLSSSRKMDALAGKLSTGGMLDAYAALSMAASMTGNTSDSN